MTGNTDPSITPAGISSADFLNARAAVAVLDKAPALLWRSSGGTASEWVSAGWAAFTGRPVADLAGDGWQRIVHPEDLERVLGIRVASFAAGTPFSLDLRLRHADGAYRWWFDSGAPELDASGRTRGFIGCCVDIHERKSLEETLAERAQQLRLAERRQGRFLAMLSHELRNPLAPIANAASVLRTLESENPILVRLREILERQVGRLGRLVEELIDVTRAAQGQISLVREAVSVEAVVQAAVTSSHDKITAGGHRLEIAFPEERLYVHGDVGRLAQSLANLVVNAAKFTPQPGVVAISVQRAARTVQISVRDHGDGIDAEFLPHAFELFAQQEQAHARTLGGLGVGLTLARRIAQLHGGEVEAFSDGPGHGSEFILWLPLIPAPVTADDAPAPPQLLERLRVLIVEDDADARESLRLQMELWGTEVNVARNAAEALEAAARVRPQIVLCDIGLPGIDGFALVSSLRAALHDTPVAFAAVTGYASADDQQRALAAGFDSFLVKPLKPDSLARLLRLHSAHPA